MILVNYFRLSLLLAVKLSLASGLAVATAGPLSRGNFLVSDEVVSGPGRIREFTPGGVLVQAFTFPSEGQPRDVAVNAKGNVEIFNGTFTPFFTELNPTAGAIDNNSSFPGWSTVNNSTYGGIATFGHFAFVSDMTTAHEGAPNGAVRFNIHNRAGIRFASGQPGISGELIDLTIGLNGLLYGLAPGGSPGGNEVYVYDPLTLAFQRRINLGVSLRTISVDVNGDLFGATINDRHIYHFDSNGNFLRAVETGMTGFVDSNFDRSGRLLLSAGENVLLTDRTLNTLNIIHVDTITPLGGIFTTWVEPPFAIPEPHTLAPVGVGLIGPIIVARRLQRDGAKTCRRGLH